MLCLPFFVLSSQLSICSVVRRYIFFLNLLKIIASLKTVGRILTNTGNLKLRSTQLLCQIFDILKSRYTQVYYLYMYMLFIFIILAPYTHLSTPLCVCGCMHAFLCVLQLCSVINTIKLYHVLQSISLIGCMYFYR